MEIKKIFDVLNQYNVKYLVCGGLAVNIYGIPRMTADIDLLLDFEDNNISNWKRHQAFIISIGNSTGNKFLCKKGI